MIDQSICYVPVAPGSRSHISACVTLLAGFWLSNPLFAEAPEPDPDCQCRAPGGAMRDLGTVECVDIVGSKKLVRCEMSTNTPYWKSVEGAQGCPDA